MSIYIPAPTRVAFKSYLQPVQKFQLFLTSVLHSFDYLALDCDFESDDLCGFTFDLSAEYNWTHSNYTPSPNTGPSSDHTHGDGKFLF